MEADATRDLKLSLSLSSDSAVKALAGITAAVLDVPVPDVLDHLVSTSTAQKVKDFLLGNVAKIIIYVPVMASLAFFDFHRSTT